MTSSSAPSSKKTRAFRSNTLIPAGAAFVSVREPPSPNALPLWRDLRNFENILPNILLSNLPSDNGIPMSAFASDAFLDATKAVQLINVSMQVLAAAEIGLNDVYNEGDWKRRVHSVALSAFEEPTQNMIALVSEETWPTISMPSNAILSMHKPDFTVAFRVGPHSKMPKLKLDDIYNRRIDPYLNGSKTLSFPLVAVESKSLLGSIFEAENQCAEGCIKMLYKLSTLSATTTRLPVIGISLVGSYFNIYIATTARVDQPFPEYQIQRLWVGDVTLLWQSLQFQIILWKLKQWICQTAFDAIVDSLQELTDVIS